MTYKSGETDLTVFVNSDYAGDTTDRKSITGYVVKLGNGVENWAARKQASVALSTCEAKYFSK